MLTVVILLAVIGAGTVVFSVFCLVHAVQNFVWDVREMERRIRELGSHVGEMASMVQIDMLSSRIRDLELQQGKSNRGGEQ